MRIQPRYPECKTCTLFTGKPSSTCMACTSGEFYEELIEPRELDNNDLMEMYGYDHDE